MCILDKILRMSNRPLVCKQLYRNVKKKYIFLDENENCKVQEESYFVDGIFFFSFSYACLMKNEKEKIILQ